MWTLALVGCFFDEKLDDTAVDTGDTAVADTADSADTSGTGAWGCVETAVTPITDTTAVATGMTLSPDAAEAAWGTTWQGSFVFTAGGEELGAFTLAHPGSWELVEREARGGGSETSTAPEWECRNGYRWTTTIEVSDASGAFGETATVVVDILDTTFAVFTATIAIDDVLGTTRPSWDPADWPYNALGVYGLGEPGVWHAYVLWQGSSAAFGSGGSVDTGTVWPSGQTETVATGDFVPAVE